MAEINMAQNSSYHSGTSFLGGLLQVILLCPLKSHVEQRGYFLGMASNFRRHFVLISYLRLSHQYAALLPHIRHPSLRCRNRKKSNFDGLHEPMSGSNDRLHLCRCHKAHIVHEAHIVDAWPSRPKAHVLFRDFCSRFWTFLKGSFRDFCSSFYVFLFFYFIFSLQKVSWNSKMCQFPKTIH